MKTIYDKMLSGMEEIINKAYEFELDLSKCEILIPNWFMEGLAENSISVIATKEIRSYRGIKIGVNKRIPDSFVVLQYDAWSNERIIVKDIDCIDNILFNVDLDILTYLRKFNLEKNKIKVLIL